MIILGLCALVMASVGAVFIASAEKEPETDKIILSDKKEVTK